MRDRRRRGHLWEGSANCGQRGCNPTDVSDRDEGLAWLWDLPTAFIVSGIFWNLVDLLLFFDRKDEESMFRFAIRITRC